MMTGETDVSVVSISSSVDIDETVTISFNRSFCHDSVFSYTLTPTVSVGDPVVLSGSASISTGVRHTILVNMGDHSPRVGETYVLTFDSPVYFSSGQSFTDSLTFSSTYPKFVPFTFYILYILVLACLSFMFFLNILFQFLLIPLSILIRVQPMAPKMRNLSLARCQRSH